MSFASPTLELLLRDTTASGRVTRAFLDTLAIASPSMVDQLRRAYRFFDSVWTPQGGRPWWVPAGVFLFRVRYLSDEREEELQEVAVNLADGRLLRRLGDALDRRGLAADPVEAWPMMAERPASEAYAVARRVRVRHQPEDRESPRPSQFPPRRWCRRTRSFNAVAPWPLRVCVRLT